MGLEDWRRPVRVLPELGTLQTGDLLLFASTWPVTLPVPLAWAQFTWWQLRIALSTNFSHCGLVVRRPTGLFVLEAMPITGVTLYPLHQRARELGAWCPLVCGRRLLVRRRRRLW